MPIGRASAFYKTPTSLQLTQQTIDAKLTSVLAGFEADLRAQFPHYDDGVKMALLDMIYNLGPAGSSKVFPTSSQPSRSEHGHKPPSTACAAGQAPHEMTGPENSSSAPSSAPSKRKRTPG